MGDRTGQVWQFGEGEAANVVVVLSSPELGSSILANTWLAGTRSLYHKVLSLTYPGVVHGLVELHPGAWDRGWSCKRLA